jgi:hypothetical protein
MARAAMPVTNDLELPIKFVAISGPGVDALESRKENNNNTKVTASRLRANYEKVKQGLNAGLKALTAAVAPK